MEAAIAAIQGLLLIAGISFGGALVFSLLDTIVERLGGCVPGRTCK